MNRGSRPERREDRCWERPIQISPPPSAGLAGRGCRGAAKIICSFESSNLRCPLWDGAEAIPSFNGKPQAIVARLSQTSSRLGQPSYTNGLPLNDESDRQFETLVDHEESKNSQTGKMDFKFCAVCICSSWKHSYPAEARGSGDSDLGYRHTAGKFRRCCTAIGLDRCADRTFCL